MSSYVALTRVERREDLLIFRPFPRHLFIQGQKHAWNCYSQVWRNDVKVDWTAIELNTCLAERVLAAQSISTSTIMQRRSGLRRQIEGIVSCA